MKIEIEKLAFSYGAHEVLKGLTFTVTEGELLCILGPNGVGKSTLFRCLLGLQRGWSGRIVIDGTDIRKLSARQMARYLAYIPQYSSPVFSYTAFQMVLMGTTSHLGMFASPGKREEERSLEALETLGISHLKDKRIGEISGGERQLVLIARAIAQDARLLIMDEPTANLDYGNQVRVMQVVGELTQQGYSILMSTHNPDQAFLYGTRVLMLKDGAVLSQGTPREALTEEVLYQAYGVEIGIHTFADGDQEYHLCVPAGRRERGTR